MQTSNISQKDSVWYPLMQHKPLKKSPPTHMVKGEGCYLTDRQGNTYLDGIAGIWCVNVGYGRKELADVAHQQMMELPYLSPTMTNTPTVLLADKLLSLLDMEGHVYFCCSGSEANEAAFKMVWQYHAQSGEPGGHQRYKIISRYRAYHGNTLAALSATGQAERKMSYAPNVPGFIHIPPPYPYRRPDYLTPAQHGLECARVLEDTIIYEGAQTVAAFIVEPMISGGGVIIPPDEYLPAVRKVCDKYGVLLIFDEVVSGFGRTGKMFGQHHWNVKPDIITCAKGITSGYMPLGATIASQKIFDAFLGEVGDLSHFRHINTYTGHPVATAVALRNLELVEEEGLTENAAKIGSYMLDQLEELDNHPLVGEIRGKGLLIGLELVSDKEKKTPLDPAKVASIVKDCKRQGVIIGRNGNTIPGLANVLVTAPPLIAKESEADRIVETIARSLNNAL
ncbi:MAG: aminotransferase [Ardenticatenaceae bacterium]